MGGVHTSSYRLCPVFRKPPTQKHGGHCPRAAGICFDWLTAIRRQATRHVDIHERQSLLRLLYIPSLHLLHVPHSILSAQMADPFSISFGIAGLITLAERLFSRTFKYAKAVRNAPQEIRSLSEEIGALNGLLHRVQLLAPRNGRPACGDVNTGLRIAFLPQDTREDQNDLGQA